MKNSYLGKVLRIDLSSKKSSVEDLNMEYAKKYLGGRGLGTKMLLDEIDPKIDALSKENKLIFISGPLTGVKISTGTRFMVVTKSPLNGCIASSNSGGIWGSKLKYAGFDAMIVEGKSDTPVYITLENGEVQFKDASELWGKHTLDVESALKGGNNDSSVLNIGIAGEKLSHMAAVMNDGDRAAARTGVGAVMGSKNLKAIVITAANSNIETCSENFEELSAKTAKRFKRHLMLGNGLPSFGTAILVGVLNECGGFPHKNWQEGYFKDYEKISGETLAEKHLVKNAYCHKCTIGCTRIVERNGKNIGGPEYESIWGFGGNASNSDMKSIIEANHLCNEYGLDVISTSSTIACAMELYEKGLIKEEECDGYPLEFGNAGSIVKWVEKIAKQDSKLAKLMAQGSYELAKAYGREDLSMSVKKLEMAAYDPRAVQGMGLNYATTNRGGCHVRGNTVSAELLGFPIKIDRHVTEGKAALVQAAQNQTAIVDSLGVCLFTVFLLAPQDYLDLFNGATGFDLTLEEFGEAGERIFAIERYFNQLAGMDPSEDKLPKRLLEEPLNNDFTEDSVCQLDKMLPEYYELRGWKNGFPTEETLKKLGIL